MHNRKWWSIFTALCIVISCFLPWVVIESKNLVISGISAEGTSYGKPGYLSLILVGIVFILSFFPKAWTQRLNLMLAAFNLGWALRNLIVLPACAAGECPKQQPALYFYFAFSVLLIISVALQKVKMPAPDNM